MGINVDPNLITINGRILPEPTLMYGQNVTVKPQNGRWNMRNKTLYKPTNILGCAIIIYDQHFGPAHEQHLKESLFNVARTLGIQGMPPDPPVLRKDATGSAYWKHLKEVAAVHESLKGGSPNLIIVVLPEMGDDIYVRIKNAGNIKVGVATQCLRTLFIAIQAAMCIKGNEQYFANVCLKINAKLGGINAILKLDTVPFLTDQNVPVIVIGAGLTHPEPGYLARPSFAAVVGSVDSGASKYVATIRPQPCRTEMIESLADMMTHVIKKHMQYRKDVERQANLVPERILFYRGGLSEGQFKKCKDFEVPQIFKACDIIGIPRPKLTFVICRHICFFPSPGGKSDKSGNVPAGPVVDCGITSPVEYDFYLQSHSGVQGTNRSTHYNILVDQNNFMPDEYVEFSSSWYMKKPEEGSRSLQSISFALCHIHASSTCSVSVVPPVYYADMVCARARNHYDPDANRRVFQSVHGHIGQHMYFL
ncbi:hypothetical protein FRC04_011505 [Tulasnella sp. 424]|nr:hypothetical protein FRC04_011505 [Tulasnella sp. 424]